MPTVNRVLLTNTTRCPIAARVAIELAKAGPHVFALFPFPGNPAEEVCAISKTFRYSSSRPIASLLTAIKSARPDLIIPCDDLAVRDLHKLFVVARKQGESWLTTLIESSLGPEDSFSIVSSRYELLRIAREADVLTPQTWIINRIDEINSSSKVPAFPWVLKAEGTWGGSGVRIAHDRNQAKAFFLELERRRGVLATLKELITNRTRSATFYSWKRQTQPSIIAQSYVDGRPANCAVVCWRGRVLAGIGVEVISSLGTKGPAIVVRPVQNREMMLAAELIAERLKLSGFFGLDFMIEAGTNLTYLIEMNPRCTPLSHLQLGEGKDLIGALMAELQGESRRRLPPVTTADLISYFPQALIYKSKFSHCSFNDIPEEEPGLVKSLLHPWSERSLIGKTLDKVRRVIQDGPLFEHVFTESHEGYDELDQGTSISGTESVSTLNSVS